MTDDKQDTSVVAWTNAANLNVLKNPEPLHYAVMFHKNTAEWNIPLSLTSDLTAMKAELEEAKKERDAAIEWRKSIRGLCVALGSDAHQWAGDKDGWGFNFEFIKWLHTRAEAVEQQLDELREALSDTLEPGGLINAAAENLRSADRDERRVEAAFRIAYQLDELRRRVAALSKPKPHDETRGRK